MDVSRVLSDSALARNLGQGTLARARVFAGDGRVRELDYDPDPGVLQAQVDGTGQQTYEVEVEIASEPPFEHAGYCSCPMGVDCQHVGAALLVMRQRWSGEPSRSAVPSGETTATRAGWESALAGVLGRPVAESGRTTPLGLRMEVKTTPTGARLQCRPVRRSHSTGRWVQGGARWTDVLQDYRRQFPPDQVKLFTRLRNAAAGAGSQHFIYGSSALYGSPGADWLTLDSAEESLWPILDGLVASGAHLVGPNDRDMVVRSDQGTEFVVDVAATDGGGLQVRPVLRDERGAIADRLLMTVGDPVHGVVLSRDHGGTAAVELVRLSRRFEAGLGGWLTAGNAVEIPAADRERFEHAFYPGLKRKVSVVSSDSSVEFPEPVQPTLRVAVHHPGAELIHLQWAVGYGPAGVGPEFGVDDLTSDVPARDLAAERKLWSELAPVFAGAPASVVDPHQPDRPRSQTQLSGLAAAEFSSELLTELGAAGVEIVHSGDRIDYQRADGPPQVVVSTEEGDGGSDWFDLTIAVAVNGESVPFAGLFRALAEGESHLILPSGLYFSLDQPEFRQLAELIAEARAIQDRERNGLRIHVQQAGLWDELTRLGVVGRQAVRWQSRVADIARRDRPAEVAAPAGLVAELRPYQLEGYRWLHQLWELALGGILADDMGLGKTLQALALIAEARASGEGSGPFLVVAPTSVLTTWMTEAARFTPGVRLVAVQQTEAKRGVALPDLAADADVVLTSYTLLRLEAEAYQAIGWRGLFLDEAQFVKNHQAKTYSSIRKLGIDFTVAMTGTPLENSLMDLWSMLSLTAPGMFPSPERFREFFQRPIERNAHPERLRRLRDRVRPVMLRRTKEQVATELPEKQEQVIEVDLHPQHARIYQRQLQRERQKVLGLIGDPEANRFAILRSLTLLRQLSLDPALVDGAHEGVPSAKVDLLLEMVTSLVAEGHRALVFSQFTTFLKRVGERLSGAGVDYAYLDGRTRNRAKVIEGFKSGTSGVFLISLKAGGFGLNLTEADYCFVLDPWWNPAAEAQAVDRAHRIGQSRPVMVYRLVSQGTIEDKVMQLKSKKQQLFDQVMSADGMPSGAFTPAEIRSLLVG